MEILKKNSVRILQILGILIALFLIVSFIGGYWFGWTWTGFGDYVAPTLAEGQEFQRRKTLWDWMGLLIIPIVLAGGTIWFNKQERKSESAIANDRLREAALQDYFSHMSALLLEKELRTSESDSEVRAVARARTLTALRMLDKERKRSLIRFLYDSKLINTNEPVISLSESDLQGVNLHWIYLGGINLRWADLKGADLSLATLNGAYLSMTDISGSNLHQVDLGGTDLTMANLQGADLSEATLHNANLRGADLTEANLRAANLIEADLHGARINSDQLAQARSLQGTIMPDGTIHG
ncbi:MAG TPA: pentapeptide repeat-containing protein [Ardenticatenaceae bacterium]|jgi:uncharacterized protein YjbI with pentapeptide repeats